MQGQGTFHQQDANRDGGEREKTLTRKGLTRSHQHHTGLCANDAEPKAVAFLFPLLSTVPPKVFNSTCVCPISLYLEVGWYSLSEIQSGLHSDWRPKPVDSTVSYDTTLNLPLYSAVQ